MSAATRRKKEHARLSKNLDDGSAWNTSVSGNTPAFVEFPLRPRLDWGPAATDLRHAASINGSYELPFGRGKTFMADASRALNFLVGGWQLNGIATLLTGFPFTPLAGSNRSGDGDIRNPDRPSLDASFSIVWPKVDGSKSCHWSS